MTVAAELADGRRLEFPDGTDPSVIQMTVKKMLAPQSLVSQIPGGENAPPPTPEPIGSILDKITAGLRTAARTALSIPAVPIAGWAAMATHGAQGPQAAGEQFQRNMAAMVPPPSAPLDIQYSENVGNAMNNLTPMVGLPGKATMVARTAGPAIGQVGRTVGNEASYAADALKAAAGKISVGGQMFNPTPETAALGQKFEAMGGKIPLHTLSSNRITRIAGDWIDNLPLSGSPKETNKVVINKELLRQIGGNENAGLLTPQSFAPAMDKSGAAIGEMYGKVTVPLDASFDIALQNILKQQSKQTPDTAKIVGSYVDDLRTAAAEHGGFIPGETLRAHDTALGKRIRALPPGDLRGELSDVQETIRDALAKQLSPEDNASLNTYRKQYAIGKLLEPLVAKNQANGVMPSELMSRQLSTAAGKHRMAMGAAGDMGDLAAIGQEFLKQSNSSGLGERGLILGALINTAKVIPAIGIGQAYNRLGPMISSRILNGVQNAPTLGVPWTQEAPWRGMLAQPPSGPLPAIPTEAPLLPNTNPLAQAPQGHSPFPVLNPQEPLSIPGTPGANLTLGNALPGASPLPTIQRESPILGMSDQQWTPQPKTPPFEAYDYPLLRGAKLVSNVELTPKILAEKMQDVQWRSDMAAKAREKAAGFDEIAKRADNAKKQLSAMDDRKSLIAFAEYLEQGISGPRPVTPKGKALGAKASAARNANQ